MPSPDSPVQRYHDGTKHHFNQFARSLGYLDWASQPDPFRAYQGARRVALYPAPGAERATYTPPATTFDNLFGQNVGVEPLSLPLVGDLLRHALGLSAWKQVQSSRWSLRVNPSSGNLHPTEAYIVCGAAVRLDPEGAAVVAHYAADAHALEIRSRFGAAAWDAFSGGRERFLVVLTSIHWREAWKYGERAFRYCQHDVGHAVACVAFAAAALGWRTRLLPEWSHRQIAALTGVDRDDDFLEAEREEPACVLAVEHPGASGGVDGPAAALVERVAMGKWEGRASQLSEDHVEWTFIDEIARATSFTGAGAPPPARTDADAPPRIYLSSASHGRGRSDLSAQPALPGSPTLPAPPAVPALPARDVFLQRRSAVAFDGVSSMSADLFFEMLARVMPVRGSIWDVAWWTPRIHLALFVHRIDGVAPGLYALGREPRGFERLLTSLSADLLREPAHDTLPLVRLAAGQARAMARRLSCDQDIASDGCYSLGMIADFDASLDEYGPAFYRNLFWESGMVGQRLYLDAEAAGLRATGIGCFYDDAVHDVLGLKGHAFQSLYHFTVGAPVEDARITTEPGYAWETRRGHAEVS